MSVYNVDMLMEQTRNLAAEYRRSTGQTLAVSGEIAKYDAVRILHLEQPHDLQAGVDAMMERGGEKLEVQIKARVIFDEQRNTYKLGKINLDGHWQMLLLVLLNKEYITTEIIALSRAELLKLIEADSKIAEQVISVPKFRVLGKTIWPASSD